MTEQLRAIYQTAKRVAAGERVETPRPNSDLGKACEFLGELGKKRIRAIISSRT